MVDISLFSFAVDAVEQLLVADGTEGHNGEDLCLTSGEHTGAVHSGQNSDLAGERTNIVHASAVNALLLVEEPAANDELLCLVQTLVDHCLLLGIDLVKFCVNCLIDGLQTLVADGLVVGVESRLYVLLGKGFDSLKHLVVGLQAGEFKLGLADLSLDAVDKVNDLLVCLVTEHDGVVHILVGYAVGACLDHGDPLAGGGDGGRHLADLALFLSGVDHKRTVNHADGAAGNGTVPRNIGDGDSDGSADHRHDLGLTVGVNAHNGADDGNVVAHALVEQRTDRTVDHTAGEDRVLGRSALSFEVGAGDPANGIHFFFVVNRERKEVYALSGLCGSRDRAVYAGLAVGHHAGAVGKLCHFAGFDLERSAGKLGFKYSVLVKSH